MSQSARHQKKTRRTRIRAAWYWIAGAVALAGMFVAWVLPHRSTANAEFPFPCLAQETLALHVHPYLRIMIEAQPVEIPSAIGIRNPRFDRGVAVSGSCFEPLHTHDSSGIIHICSVQSTSPPCFPTAVGNPFPAGVLEQYGTGHTIVIEFL